MTDEWLVDGLPVAGDWTGTGPCAPAGNANSIVDAITITGAPGAITSVQNDRSLWALVLNDGTPAADFRVDRFDDAGALASSPMAIVRATGVVSFRDPVMLPADPADPLEAATKHYVDVNAAGLTDAPDDGAFYGRKSLTWANPSHSDIADWAAALAPYALLTDVPPASTAPPLMDGTAAPGSAGNFARGDHVHPTDSSRYAASNPAGYQTAAQVTASLAPYALTASVPVASTTTPAMNGTAAVGAGTTWARADHVHPSDTSRLAISGGTMTGALTLAADPVAAMQPATKQYVDGGRLGDNRIINGDMRIDQRNNGASGTAMGYTADRWQYSAAQTSKLAWQRTSGSTTFGAAYWLYFQSSSAYTPLTTDYFGALQIIEADMVSDFMWGTANAQPVTLSFWMFSSLTGTFGGSIRNAANTRSYPFSWSAPAASTWTRVVVTIPGDTAGTWVMNGNAGALSVAFDLGSGATFRGPANAWAGANYVGATGSVNVIGTNAAQFAVTAVKLEIGAVATPFNRQSLTKSLADCQRYYVQSGLQFWFAGYGAAGGIAGVPLTLPTTMRAAPTVVVGAPAYTNCSALNAGILNPANAVFTVTVTALGGFIANTAIGALAFNAEL